MQFPQFNFFKGKKTGDGAASSLDLRTIPNEFGYKTLMFWKMAQQNGPMTEDENATFFWQDPSKYINVKIGLPDIAGFLSVLNGSQDKVTLFHKNDKGNVVIDFGYYETEKSKGFGIKFSAKEEDKRLEIKHAITTGEAVILQTLLLEAVKVFSGWGVGIAD